MWGKQRKFSMSILCFCPLKTMLQRSCEYLACDTDETKLWLSPSAKQRRNPCSRTPLMNQDLTTRHDWPVKNAIVKYETPFRSIC